MKYRGGIKNENYVPVRIFGEDVEINEAPEPSDIIWENLEVKPRIQRRRTFLTGVSTVIFLILTFILFTELKTKAGENNLKYPTSLDCDHVS